MFVFISQKHYGENQFFSNLFINLPNCTFAHVLWEYSVWLILFGMAVEPKR